MTLDERLNDPAQVLPHSDGLTAGAAADEPADEVADAADVRELVVEPQRGVRLVSVQVLNWGTFDSQVWEMAPDGGNYLLTGEIGAGKSTLIDALTTLLVPTQKVTFNKAAGADRSERSLRTYVLGQYARQDVDGMAQPKFLRKPGSTPTILVAAFRTDTGELVSAGVVMSLTEASTTPHRLFFLTTGQVRIVDDLAGRGSLREIRSTLKELGAETWPDNFTGYQKELCRQLRTTSGALALLAQTVSMKQVGNLTEFVRAHMLAPADVTAAIDRMLAHYADLVRAHDVVVDARKQRDMLEPVYEHSRTYDRALARITAAETAQAALTLYVDTVRAEVLRAVIADAHARLPTLTKERARLAGLAKTERDRVLEHELALTAAGGVELERAANKLETLRQRATEAAKRVRDVRALATNAALAVPLAFGGETSSSAAAVAELVNAVDAARREVTAQLKSIADTVYDRRRALEEAKVEFERVRTELKTAESRDSNIPPEYVALRDRIAAAVDAPSESLPYAGELLTISPEHARWEGAAERLMRPFAISLLVGEELYPKVAAFVDANHLGARLTYYRVPAAARSQGSQPAESLMAAKVVVRPSTAFSGWLVEQVAVRFDHVCVEDARALSGAQRGVTVNGQVKDRDRHEKNDRFRVDDRSRFVLGWDTRRRRADLAARLPQLQQTVKDALTAADATDKTSDDLRQRGVALELLLTALADPQQLDLAGTHDAVQAARNHHDTLAKSPSISRLKALRDAARAKADELDGQVEGVVKEWARLDERREQADLKLGTLELRPLELDRDSAAVLEAAARRAGATAGLAVTASPPAASSEERPDDSSDGITGETTGLPQADTPEAVELWMPEPDGLDSCERWERALHDELKNRVSSFTNTRDRTGQRLVAAMKEFGNRWEQLVRDTNTSDVACRTDLLAIRSKLLDDDLPRFERNFREQLETNAIQEIAVFNQLLEDQSGAIRGRVATINKALVGSDYRVGTYITLQADWARDQGVSEFRAQLRQITEGALSDDSSAYSEDRFLLVRDLLDRLSGRDGSANADQVWREKVTDVRNWYAFTAAELSRDERVQVELYTDSDGKSGGQKEKLAVTILAVSLAYQYGLADGDESAFRFVMMDEAFVRGDENATEYGLNLFRALGLQVLVVTPMQKVRTIERFVQGVGYVDAVGVNSSTGPRSRLMTMTIQEFRRRRAADRAGTAPVTAEPSPAGEDLDA